MARRPRLRFNANPAHTGQLSLAIETDPVPTGVAHRPSNRKPSVKRELALDPIVYMSDVVVIVGRHRSTIHRWIKRHWFPAPSMPPEHPLGWLRSELEHWQRGTGTGASRPAGSTDTGENVSDRHPKRLTR
jgi:predicted DNA-binding transcriptional regulator AlpA